MPFYLHQVSYTPEALAKLIGNPQDRFEAVRGPIEKLGGKIKDSYFAFGPYDAVLITEMPDNVAAAAIALAFSAGGALRNCQTTALMTNTEALDAMRKAGTCGYKPITAKAATAKPVTLLKKDPLIASGEMKSGRVPRGRCVVRFPITEC